MDIDLDRNGAAVPDAAPVGAPASYAPVEHRRGLAARPPARTWYAFGNRLNVRIENVGGGASITGIRLSPLPPGALVDWNKALPANVAFEGAGLAIRGATRRGILDTLASVRIALPRSAAEHPELVLEIGLRVGGVDTTAVTTVALADAAAQPGRNI